MRLTYFNCTKTHIHSEITLLTYILTSCLRILQFPTCADSVSNLLLLNPRKWLTGDGSQTASLLSKTYDALSTSNKTNQLNIILINRPI